ncbi:MAG: serine/threonine protein kinase [Cyanobacteria bacterium]|nr:serine/threonine protein kinase [Cyanobacteriota bacterium]
MTNKESLEYFETALDSWLRASGWLLQCATCGRDNIDIKPFERCPFDYGELVPLKGAAAPGPMLKNRFQLLRPVGYREFTVSYLVLDRQTNREAIVHFLNDANPVARWGNRAHRLAADAKTSKKFIEGTNAMIPLRHPNIYEVLDTGTLTSEREFPGDVPYYIGSPTRGAFMADLLALQGRLAPSMVISVFIDVLTSLQYAHDMKIHHTNLSLSSILLCADSSVKVLDFGIATRVLGGLDWQGSASVTRTSNLYGSTGAMAPEVILGSNSTSKSDVYSVGCCMYESLSGVPVLQREAELFTLYAHLNDTPEPFDPSLNIPPELESIVLKCLEKKPADRFEITELRELLKALSEQPSWWKKLWRPKS